MTEIITTEEMECFLRRYSDFTRKFKTLRFNEFREGFNHAKYGQESIKALANELERHVTHNYNVFYVLGVGSREVKTHSAFLADLLNPNGKHGQGTLFLKGFVDIIDPKNKFTEEEIDSGNWYVEKEKVTAFGNLDIVVKEASLSYILIIENKIYAKDQIDQLKRYDTWLKNEPYKKGMLLYLSLDGRPSIDADRDRIKYTRVGYRVNPQEQEIPNVTQWIKQSLGLIPSPRMSDILKQYLHLIDSL